MGGTGGITYGSSGSPYDYGSGGGTGSSANPGAAGGGVVKIIVGDDLTVTNYKRLQKAIEGKSINAIIVKPNQNGSLLDVSRVCELAKKNNIKIIFSHRSGETEENILADFAFGFQADFLKAGITGKTREPKIKRLIEIEKKIKR